MSTSRAPAGRIGGNTAPAAATPARPRSARETPEALQGFFNLRRSHAPSFATSTRFPTPQVDVFRNTGPGAYTPRQISSAANGCSTFGTSKRQDLWAKKDPVTRAGGAKHRGTPGPGAYTVRPASANCGVSFGTASRSTYTVSQFLRGKTFVGNKAKEGMRAFHDDALITTTAKFGTAVANPGPGEYDVDFSSFGVRPKRAGTYAAVESPLRERIHGGFISRTTKAYMQPGYGRGKGTPGPGAYTPLWGA